MAANPQFASTPKVGIAQISTANTNRDGTGTIGTVFTAGSSGSRIDQVVVTATAATTAGVVRLYIHDGSNARLLKEVMVSAITPSTSVETFTTVLNAAPFPLVLPVNYSLRASTHNAETFNVTASGGDL